MNEYLMNVMAKQRIYDAMHEAATARIAERARQADGPRRSVLASAGTLLRRPGRALRRLPRRRPRQLARHQPRVEPALRQQGGVGPASTTRPSSSTTIWSARLTVESRWAMMTVVR